MHSPKIIEKISGTPVIIGVNLFENRDLMALLEASRQVHRPDESQLALVSNLTI